MKFSARFPEGVYALAITTLATFCAIGTQAQTVDLATGDSGTVNGALFKWTPERPTGTGYIDPFVRIQRKHTEQGYNTSGRPFPFDEKDPLNYTHDLKLNQLAPIIVNGVEYYQFLLDINEPGNTKAFLSLDKLQIYTSTQGSLTTRNVSELGALRYDLDAGADNWILLDAARNSGSGSGDMLALIPTRLFAGAKPTDFLYLYSQFGTHFESRSDDSEAGFEEWAVVAGPAGFPCPSATAHGGTISCEKPTVQISATTDTSSATFQWTGPNGFTSTNQNPTVSVAGNYVVTVTGPSGCSATDTAIVTANKQAPTVTATGGTITCAQLTVQLKATSSAANSTFKWTGPGIVSGADSATPTVNAAGTYTVTVTDSSNGCSESATALVVENKGLTVSAKGGEITCDKLTVKLEATASSTNVTFQWTGPSIVTGANTATPTVNAAGAYTVTASDSKTGCSEKATATVTLNQTAPKVTATGGELTCASPSLRLTATVTGVSSEVTLAWSGPGIVSGANTPNPIVNQPGTYTVTVTVKTTGCSGTATATVTENKTQLAVTATNGKLPACPTIFPPLCNNFATFTQITQGGWGSPPEGNNPGKLLADNFASVYPSGSVVIGGGFTLKFTSASAIQAFLPQGSAPAALTASAVNPTSKITVFAGQVLALRLNIDFSAKGLTRFGLGDLVLTSGKLAGMTVNAVSDLANRVLGGDLSALPAGVSISNLNDIVASINENFNSCATDNGNLAPPSNPTPAPAPSIQLTATASSQNVEFHWSGPGIVSGGETATVTVNKAGSYVVTVTDKATGCSGSATAVVTQEQATIVAGAVGGVITCSKSLVQLSASTSSANPTFQWSGPGIVSGANTATPVVNAAGTYTVVVTDTVCGASASATAIVSENKNAPTVTAVGGTLTCAQPSIQLKATASKDGVTFHWTGPGILSGGETATPTVGAAGTYTITVTDKENGCSATATASVTETTTRPTVTATGGVLTPSTPTIQLSATASMAVDFSWTGPGIVSGANTATPTVNAPGTYTVKAVATANGCEAVATAVVTAEKPSITVTATGGVLTCAETTIKISATTSATSPTFSWSGPGIVSGGDTSSPKVAAPGNYTVVVTDTTTGATGSAVAVVTENKGQVSASAKGGELTCVSPTVQVSATTSAAAPKFSWSGPGIVSGGNTATATVNLPGTYTVTVTDSNTGCSATAAAPVTENKTQFTVTATNGKLPACPTIFPPLCNNFATFTQITQGGWGSPPEGNNPGKLLADNFAFVYPSGSVVIGGGFTLKFTSASAIQAFLPQGSAPAALTASAVNPTSKITVFAGQVLALRLNIDFSAKGLTRAGLGDLVLTSGKFAGMTVNAVSDLANRVLGGDLSALPAGVSISNLNDVVASINENFNSCTTDNGNLTPPPGTTPAPAPSIQLTATASSPNVEFHWSGPGIVSGGETATVTVNKAGNYTVTATDKVAGCSASATGVVTQEQGTIVIGAVGGVITCAKPLVQLSASTSSANATFQWSGPGIVSGANTATPVVNAAGTYTVVVNDTVCGASASASAIVFENRNAPTVTAVGGSLTCIQPTVQLKATASKDEVSFKWTGPGILSGGETATPTVGAAGVYTVTVTDKETGCSATATASVTETTTRPTVTATGGVLTPSTPTIQLSATASMAVNFSWTGPGIVAGANTATPTVNAPGGYTVKAVAIANGCEAVATAVVTAEKPSIAVTATGGVLTCAETVIRIHAETTATSPSFSWSGPGIVSGGDTSSPKVAAAGNYTVVVTDTTTGAMATAVATVTENKGQVSASAKGGELTCASPTVQVSATTAAAAPKFSWSGPGIISGGNTPTATVNLPGTYKVTVTDSTTGCSAIAEARVTENKGQLTVNATGGSLSPLRPSIQLNATSSSQNVTFHWSGLGIVSGGDTATPTVNRTGTYIVTVTDKVTGCSASAIAVVTEERGISVSAVGNTLTCSSPVAQLSAKASVPNATFQWSGPGIVSGGNTPAPVVNAAGTYTVVATDTATGSSATTTASVTENKAPPTVTATGGILTCVLPSVQLSATGSKEGLSFTWTGPGIISGGNTATPTVGSAGTYTVTATDTATGCSATATAVVTETTIRPTVAATGGVLTPAAPTVQLNATASMPVTFSWSGPGIVAGGNTATPTVNVAGTYTVTATAIGTGCASVTTALVTEQKPPVIVTATGGVLTCNESVVTLHATTTTTTPSFSWSGPGILSGGSTATPTVGLPGNYLITVTDTTTGNVGTALATVTENKPQLTATATGGQLTCANPTIQVSATTSSTAPRFNWSGPGVVSGGNSPTATVNLPGTYTVIVTDTATGCTTTAQTTVTENKGQLTATATGGQISTAQPSIQLSVTSSSGNASFHWTGPSILSGGETPTPTVNAPGTYVVTVTDNVTGCSISALAVVTEKRDITVLAVGGTITCANPTVQLSAPTSSTSPTFRWTGPGIVSGGETATPTVNAPGIYTVVVTDTSTGVSSTAKAVVIENKFQPTVTATGGELNCIQSLLQLRAVASVTGVTLSWTGPGILSGANTATPTVGVPGTYTVTATDLISGCFGTATAQVTQNMNAPTVTATGGALTPANPTLVLRATASGPASFGWTGPGILSGGNTASPTVNMPGTYVVTATDQNTGCASSARAVVTQEVPGPTVAAFGAALDCINDFVRIRATTTSTPVTFTWKGPGIISGANTATPTVGAAGRYTVIVTDTTTGKTASAIAVVQDNRFPVNVNATGGVLDCINTEVLVRAFTSSPNVSFHWMGPGIVSGQNTATAKVNLPGIYTVTATDRETGCTAMASAIVRENSIPPFSPNLPSFPVSFKVVTAANSYFQTTILDAPPGFTVTNGTYAGWCIHFDEPIKPDTTYKGTLFFCYGENLPDHLRPFDWKRVNYILNHKQNATGLEVQNAIWYFIGRPSNQPLVLDTVSQALVNDALVNGECFSPQPGDHVAVAMDTGPSSGVQGNMIEVQLPKASDVKIRAASISSVGELQLSVEGPPSGIYSIQASSDLVNWATVGTAVSSSGKVSFSVGNSSEFPIRFYRALLKP